MSVVHTESNRSHSGGCAELTPASASLTPKLPKYSDGVVVGSFGTLGESATPRGGRQAGRSIAGPTRMAPGFINICGVTLRVGLWSREIGFVTTRAEPRSRSGEAA